MAKIQILDIKVDGDHRVTGAWEFEGPIYLVRFESKDGKTFRSRFDAQKEIFIDPFGAKVDQTGIKRIAKSLAAPRASLFGAKRKSP